MGDFVNAKKQGARSLHEPITDFVLYEPETEAVLVVESDKPVKKTRRVAKSSEITEALAAR